MDFDLVTTVGTAVAAVVAAVATVATAIILFKELRHLRDHAQASFEDDLSREYREIVGSLPVEAFYIDGALAPWQRTKRTKSAFYRYFDLSNQQLFLGSENRVTPEVLG